MIAFGKQFDMGTRSVPVPMKDPGMKRIVIGRMTTDARIDTIMSTHLNLKIVNRRTLGVATPNLETMGTTGDLKILVRWTRIPPMTDRNS